MSSPSSNMASKRHGGWRLRFAVQSEQREYSRLQTHFVLAVHIIINWTLRSQGLLIETVDVQRHSVLVLRVTVHPAGGIKLQFEECCAWVMADVLLGLRIWIIKNVRIGIGRAFVGGQGIGLRIAEGHAKPERWMQLEIPHCGAARSLAIRIRGEHFRIGR